MISHNLVAAIVIHQIVIISQVKRIVVVSLECIQKEVVVHIITLVIIFKIHVIQIQTSVRSLFNR